MRFNPNCRHNPKRILIGYWMKNEIRLHSSPSVFPDWSVKWKQQKSKERRKKKYKECEKTREKILEAAKIWRAENSEYVKKRKSEWQKSLSPQTRREAYLRYWSKNKEEIRRRKREKSKRKDQRILRRLAEKKRLENPAYKIRKNLGRGLSSICKRQGYIKDRSVLRFIGCSIEFFLKHLESQFKGGMTWENYGTFWHVDHIIPCASFDHSDENQIAQCWHWTNLRPLKAKENLFKSCKITEPQMSLLIDQ